MNHRTRRRLGTAVLVLGLCLFALGAGALVFGYRSDVPLAVVGALALLFVGVGSALQNDGRAVTE